MSKNVLKGASLAATVVGLLVTFVGSMISQKQQEYEIEEAVNKALAERDQEQES